MLHNFSVWREPQAGADAPTGPLWVKCRCGWSEHARTYDGIEQLAREHRDEAERLEQDEAEEAQHAQ